MHSNLKLINPITIINNNHVIIKDIVVKLNNIIDKRMIKEKNNLDYLINTLKLVNPLNILSNGYSLVRKNNKVIRSVNDLELNDEINIKLHEGEIMAKVKEIK